MVDSNIRLGAAPYGRHIDDPEFQGIGWLAIRPQIKNAPVVVRSGPIDHGL
ncbi:hypothetical protein ACFL5F_03455 [Planctomycetota bacterium]